MNVEVVKFKKLLEWFVRQLKINNDVIPGVKISGQGYKGHKIRESYDQWRKYDNFDLDVAMQQGYQKNTQANYIHCTQTWMNVVPFFDKTGENSVVNALQIVYKPDNKVLYEGTRRALYELGLEDGNEPNEKMISFFEEFKRLAIKYIGDEWWPSLSKYNPGLSKEDWKKYLREIEIPEHPNPMKMLKQMLELGGTASCKQLSDKYGESPNFYVGCVVNLGRRVKNYFNLSACMDGDQERYFPFPFQGKYRGSSEDNYIYRMRPELKAALLEIMNDGRNTKQWWIKQLNEILNGSKYVALDNPTITEDNVIVVEKGTQRPHYIGIKPKRNDQFGTWIRKDYVDEIKNRVLPAYTEIKGNVYHYQSIDDFDFVFEAAKILATNTELPPERKESKNMELNTILYGPPGTGKTYHTALYAVSIIEEIDIETLKKEEYSEILDRYNMYKEAGLIEFTTFHQSFGYEEFIEGIKPVVADDGQMTYEVVPGMFKRFCDKAATPKAKKIKTNANPVVWKVSLAGTGKNPIRTECLEKGHIRIGWDNYGEIITDDTDFINGGKSILNAFINEMREGDIVISCYSESTADAIGIVSGGYSWNPEYTEYKRVRPVKWISKGSFNITDINGGKNMTLSTVYKLNNIEMDKLYTYMAEEKEVVSENKDNYVFIIDEINRGNVSKILGETITLIEESKRKGAEEELLVTLPYSGKKFGVPQNVYIIGTMNTADRSIATLDTALRRRFYFKEMLPNPDVFAGIEVGGVSISNLLERINKRIEVLYDREHTIGHSYFMALKKDPSIDALARIFENNIIPLLQEYFYEDYEKIRLVLGDSKKADKDTMFIIAEQNDYSALFGNVDIGLDDGYSYKINKKAFTNIEAYKSI